MTRYIIRITLRLAIIILIIWGVLHSCIWMGEMTGEKFYRESPYYNKNYNHRYY